LLNSFFVNEIDYYYGTNIAIGDIDGDSIGEILVGNGNGSEPRLKAFDLSGKLKFNNLVHTASYRGGVRPSFISY